MIIAAKSTRELPLSDSPKEGRQRKKKVKEFLGGEKGINHVSRRNFTCAVEILMK